MNGTEAYQALRGRGYTRDQADLAMSRAPLSDDGTYRLSRHRVSWGRDNWTITPIPWTDDPGTEPVSIPPDRGPGYYQDGGVPEILEIIGAVDAWLDGAVAKTYRNQPLAQDWARTAKVGEELGEAQEELTAWQQAALDQARVTEIDIPAGRAISALIAVTGQNPRKGVHGTQEALLKELADVVCTGLFAIQHFTKDAGATWEIIMESLAKAMSRVPGESPFPPESGMTRQDAIDNGITG